MKYSVVYALRCKASGELLSKFRGNPFYTSKSVVEKKAIEYGNSYEMVTFNLYEVKYVDL